MSRINRWSTVLLGLALLVTLLFTPAVAQEIRAAPANRVSPALYCGNVVLTLYTQNAGNPAIEFRAADYNVGESGQRYFIDPEIGGAIQGVWFAPAELAANLNLFREIVVSPAPNNDRLFVLELLAERDVEPGRISIVVHFACRPGPE